MWYLHGMIYTNSTTNYTNIDTQKSVHFAVSRTETRLKMHQTCILKYWWYAEHCRPCTRLSDETKKKKKTRKKKTKKKKTKQKTNKTHTLNCSYVPIGYSLFADHRSVPSFGPGFFCLTLGYLWPNRVCALISR